MADITLVQFKDFVVVALAILAFVVLLGNVVKVFKEWRKPQDNLTSWQADVNRKLNNDNKRIEDIEKADKVICRGILALLSHEINGNSTEKLKDSQKEITDYLIER